MWRYLLFCILLASTACVSEGYGQQINQLKAPSRQQQQNALARIKTQLAMEYLHLGDYRQSLNAIHEALQAEPHNIDALLVQAHIYQTLKQNTQAEQTFRKALQLNPQHAESNNNYGWFLCHHLKLPEKSLFYFQRALADATYPTPHIAHLNQALCLEILGRHDEAKIALNEAQKSKPDAANNIRKQFEQYQTQIQQNIDFLKN